MQKKSYSHGTHSIPLRGETIGENLESIVRHFPDREALVIRHQGVRWTYSELNQQIDNFASGLLTLGLKPGDRLGIWAPNCSEWVIAQYATAKIGVILVNINPAYRVKELQLALKRVSAKALILASSCKTYNYLEMLQTLAPELEHCQPGNLVARNLPDLRIVLVIDNNPPNGMYSFESVKDIGAECSRDLLEKVSKELQFDEPINIQFTSGTTGNPKGATLTHFNILNNAFFVAELMRFSEHDRLCIPVPLYHCFGMVLGNLVCTTHGSTMVFPSETFDPKSVLETIEEERCTALHGVPTMFIAELEHPDFSQYNLTSLRTGIMAGAPCPVEVMKKVISDMNMSEITIAYGMTETSPVSFQSGTDEQLEKRVTTVGKVHPHVEAKVVDINGKIVPRGIQGELLTRGYLVMPEYWNDEERTREVIDSAGWLHSGDLAVMDEEGYLDIVGRLKDMVIRGGENIFPKEIEEYLYTHPDITNVQVFGVPDKNYGEELCAWIQLRDGIKLSEEDIKRYCKDHIAYFKIPRYIRFVESFPMTVTGKVQKYMMRKKMVEELHL